MRSHLYRLLKWPEVKQAAQDRTVILVPVAAIEQHGYHLPVDMDNLAVEHVTEEAARRSNGLILVMPPVHYGFNEHNMGFLGTINIREQVFMDFCYDIGHSLTRQGFDRIVYVNAHGSNQMLCNLVARRLVNTTPALAAALPHWNLSKDVVDRIRESEFPGGMAHACEFETSIYLHLKPELVESDKMAAETPSKSPSLCTRICLAIVRFTSSTATAARLAAVSKAILSKPLRKKESRLLRPRLPTSLSLRETSEIFPTCRI